VIWYIWLSSVPGTKMPSAPIPVGEEGALKPVDAGGTEKFGDAGAGTSGGGVAGTIGALEPVAGTNTVP